MTQPNDGMMIARLVEVGNSMNTRLEFCIETMDAGVKLIDRKHILTPQATSCHHERATEDTDAEKSVIVTQGT